MKDVQCYKLLGGIALKNHAFSFFMEMLSSFGGDNHEFCLVVIKFKHVRSCQSFDITYALLYRVK